MGKKRKPIADAKTKSFGCHLLPLSSVYVDLPVMRINVSFANVSTGLRRPPSWVASNPHCLKSMTLVSAAGATADEALSMPPKSTAPAAIRMRSRPFKRRECNSRRWSCRGIAGLRHSFVRRHSYFVILIPLRLHNLKQRG